MLHAKMFGNAQNSFNEAKVAMLLSLHRKNFCDLVAGAGPYGGMAQFPRCQITGGAERSQQCGK